MRQTKLLLPTSVEPYFGRSSQVAVSPCWKMALPDVISTVCVKALGPVPRRVPVIQSVCAPFLLGQGTGIPGHRPRCQSDTLGTRIVPRNATSTGGCLSRLQSFANVQAPLLARPPGCTYRCDMHRAARPFTSRNEHGVTRLDRSRFSMNCDIATYPKRTNWYDGTFTRKTVALSAATRSGPPYDVSKGPTVGSADAARAEGIRFAQPDILPMPPPYAPRRR